MRLIDADALMKDIDNELFSTESRKCWEKMRVRKQPTIDAEPVRHAIFESTGYDEAWCEWGDCSNCGTSNIILSKFCCECGARIKEGYYVVNKERSN